MKKYWWIALVVVLIGSSFAGGYWWSEKNKKGETEKSGEKIAVVKDLPLLPYTIDNLAKTAVAAGEVTLEKVTVAADDYTSAIFSFLTSDGKKMTGLMNLPYGEEATQAAGTVVMLRGYVAPQNYESGVGTKNAGIYFARHGLTTFAPDFLGYGESEAAPEDSWLGRFEKPLQVKQLIADLENNQFVCDQEQISVIEEKREKKRSDEETRFLDLCANLAEVKVKNEQLFIWAHSNGGQIALTTLEIIDEMLPTTLWAPVSVGFPYSVLFFTDEYEDEGKGMRQYIHSLEEDCDVFDFSHTQHLDKLAAGQRLQWHHGTSDEAALIAWSDEFMDKIKAENKEREDEAQIVVDYYRYEGADHNLRPAWDTVVARDLEFFQSFLTSEDE